LNETAEKLESRANDALAGLSLAPVPLGLLGWKAANRVSGCPVYLDRSPLKTYFRGGWMFCRRFDRSFFDALTLRCYCVIIMAKMLS